MDESGVTIRSIVKTPPFKQADVSREWRRRIKEEFDRVGIELTQRGFLPIHEKREEPEKARG